MILYSENPNLKLTKVTTVRGDVEYRRNCKFIGEKYYLMERDCFYIGTSWYRFDGGKIAFDYENKTWVLVRNSNLVNGIVSFENGSPVYGSFTPNPYNNVYAHVNKKVLCINSEILIENGFFEDVAIGTYYSKKALSGMSEYRKRTSIRNEVQHTNKGYNIEDNESEYQQKVKLYNNYTIPLSPKNKIFSKFLEDYTFGAEIEIAKGNLPEHIQNRHGVVICRDGSIDGGPELVTIPLSGGKGVQTLDCLSKELFNRGEISLSCSLHLHIGNVPTDKQFLTAFYILCRKIQDEVFTMFPYYKTDPRGVKRKNYNQKLNHLNIYSLKDKSKEGYHAYTVDAYAKMFNFLAQGRMTLDQFNKRTRAHPIARKWERDSRYYWSNLMNMFFSNRNTLEFRLSV